MRKLAGLPAATHCALQCWNQEFWQVSFESRKKLWRAGDGLAKKLIIKREEYLKQRIQAGTWVQMS
jgi:hypothetical protein